MTEAGSAWLNENLQRHDGGILRLLYSHGTSIMNGANKLLKSLMPHTKLYCINSKCLIQQRIDTVYTFKSVPG